MAHQSANGLQVFILMFNFNSLSTSIILVNNLRGISVYTRSRVCYSGIHSLSQSTSRCNAKLSYDFINIFYRSGVRPFTRQLDTPAKLD